MRYDFVLGVFFSFFLPVLLFRVAGGFLFGLLMMECVTAWSRTRIGMMIGLSVFVSMNSHVS